jgi:hypothetical protein
MSESGGDDLFRAPAAADVPAAVSGSKSVSATCLLTCCILFVTVAAAVFIAVHFARAPLFGPPGRFGGNIRHVSLALLNYHDTFDSFPPGTVAVPGLTVDQQFSWAVLTAPFIDGINSGRPKAEPRLHEGWASPYNRGLDLDVVKYFHDSDRPTPRADPWSGDFVGIAGMGADAAVLPDGHPRAGVFGYQRTTTLASITDGASNTMMLSTLMVPNHSIYAGGRETVRGFSQRPYLNGPDGIGSDGSRGVPVLLADGSVRALKPEVDPAVVEALATKAGGEKISKYRIFGNTTDGAGY